MQGVLFLAAGSIVMAVDKLTSHLLATGDVDGIIKVWNIRDYCIEETGEICRSLPRKPEHFVRLLYASLDYGTASC
jgi:hypothetical protein